MFKSHMGYRSSRDVSVLALGPLWFLRPNMTNTFMHRRNSSSACHSVSQQISADTQTANERYAYATSVSLDPPPPKIGEFTPGAYQNLFLYSWSAVSCMCWCPVHSRCLSEPVFWSRPQLPKFIFDQHLAVCVCVCVCVLWNQVRSGCLSELVFVFFPS